MNDLQRTYIENARKLGASYNEIAQKTGLPKDTIKKYCKRFGLIAEEPSENTSICKYCGKPITIIPGRKPKIFCSRECGLAWWGEHPEQRNSRIQTQIICPQCGQTFINTRNRVRRFCSIDCYAAFKKKGANHDSQ